MNKQWSILKISVISFLLLSNAVSFGMYCNHKGTLAVPRKKKLITSLCFRLWGVWGDRLYSYKNFEDNISVMQKELCYNIVALLAPIDRNNMQRTSKCWNALGSKRVPNVYNIVSSEFFKPDIKNSKFLFYCATYDKRNDVLEKLKGVKPDSISWAFYTWLSDIDYNDQNGPSKYRSFSDTQLWNESSCKNRPTELEMACYSGNINKLKDMLAVYDDTKKSFDYNRELIPAVAIAIDKNDFDSLGLFTSLLKKAPYYTNMLYPYCYLLEIALRAKKKEAFDFLSDQFPLKPLKYFILPFKDYMELKIALLSGNKKNFYFVLERLGCNKEYYEDNDNDYHEIVSLLTSTTIYYENDTSHAMRLAQIVNYINAERKKKGWETSAEIFTRQDKDLNICIKRPLLQALKDNNLDRLKTLIGELEATQFLFDRQQRAGENSLFSLHVELLQKARQLNNKEAFFLLSCLRLTVITGDLNNMICAYDKYSQKISHEKSLMETRQSCSLKDYICAHVVELVGGYK